jgi:hypothetical protein
MNNLILDSNSTESSLKFLYLTAENFIEIFTGKKIEKLCSSKLFLSDAFKYPELHEGSFSFIIIYRKIQYMMISIGIEKFCINDYFKSNILHNKRILVALNNFSFFRNNQIRILNKMGFNLTKINLECYLTLNKLLVSKYKFKFIKNKINTIYNYVKYMRKNFNQKIDFLKIYKQLFFFFLHKIYFCNKTMIYSKFLTELKYIIQIKKIFFIVTKKNSIIRILIKKNKKIIKKIVQLTKIYIILLNFFIIFLIENLSIFILISDIFKIYFNFYKSFKFFNRKNISYFYNYQDLVKNTSRILGFYSGSKFKIHGKNDFLNITDNLYNKNILLFLNLKNAAISFYFYVNKNNIKKKVKKTDKIYKM